MLDWSLLSGPVPFVLRLGALAGGVWLTVSMLRSGRRGRAPTVQVVVCLLAAAVVTAALDHLLRSVWMLFPDRLEPVIYVWAGMAVFAVFLAATEIASQRRLRRGAAVLTAATVIVAACANQINTAYGAYLTPRDALGLGRYDDITLGAAGPDARVLPRAVPVSSRWSAPPGLPARGKLTTAAISGSASGFRARDAQVYLPPAYFSDPRPQLPVLVLLAGQPGSPRDWLRAGHLARIMDRFAADHRGLTPVVVVPDDTGSRFGNPLCLDSRRGKADTYLARDVPAWIKRHLTVDADPRAWAIGGVSYGGTCALQLSANHPRTYPTFLDISGSAEPTLGNRSRTITEAFGGDREAFSRVNPLEVLAAHHYPGSAAAIVVGGADRDTKPDARLVYKTATAAGMACHYREVPGGHDWHAFSAALDIELPWLAARMGLTDPLP